MATDVNDLIFIKRVKKAHHDESHGGAWKIAYADFVTAMMAFFLLMWLLNATTEEQRTAISNYFAPASISQSKSGAGGVMGGRTMDEEGAMSAMMSKPGVVVSAPKPSSSDAEVNNNEDGSETASGPLAESDAINATMIAIGEGEGSEGGAAEGQGGTAEGQESAAEAEEKSFEEAQAAIEQAIASDPALAEFKNNVRLESTPAGLRIELLDSDEREMFPLGSAEPLGHLRDLLTQVAGAVHALPNKIAISGHTDAVPFQTDTGYSNWELSTDRAHASRRALIDALLPEDRIVNVAGKASSDPLITSDPNAAGNRRVSIVLLREHNPDDPVPPSPPVEAPQEAAPAPTPDTAVQGDTDAPAAKPTDHTGGELWKRVN